MVKPGLNVIMNAVDISYSKVRLYFSYDMYYVLNIF